MTAPYDLDYVDQVQKYICAYKIWLRRYKLERNSQ